MEKILENLLITTNSKSMATANRRVNQISMHSVIVDSRPLLDDAVAASFFWEDRTNLFFVRGVNLIHTGKDKRLMYRTISTHLDG